MVEISEIVAAISNAIEGAKIEVSNPQNDGLHFHAIVISSHFENLSLIARHRLVQDPLKELLSSKLHALSIKTYTPQEWEKKQNV